MYGSWGSTSVVRGDDWANTKRFTNRQTGTTTRVTRGDQGGMISRRGPDGSGFVGKRGENVYAGRDGNVYRRDDNGNWSKWQDGGWNQVEKPSRDAVRDSMLNDNARRQQREQIDRSTYQNLERDRASRNDGAQRTRDRGTYQNRGGGSAGSYRGGGASRGGGGFRGGGGGFRGGGRRR